LTNCEKCGSVVLSKSQGAFLEYCKEFGWGKLEVVVKGGEPVMVVEIRRETKLD